MKKALVCVTVIALLSAIPCAGSSQVEGANWPQWGGPNRNFILYDGGYDPLAFADGVDVLWEADVGFGRSSIVVSDGYLYTLGRQGQEKAAYCINLKNGKTRWVVPFRKIPFGESLSTPAVDGDRVYVLSPAGDVLCLDTRNGKTLWEVKLKDSYGVNSPDYGFASSPIVYSDIVVIHANSLLVAFDKMNGQEYWAHIDEDEEITDFGIYSTPFLVDDGEIEYLIRQGQVRLEAFELKSGKLVAQIEVQDPGRMVYNICDGIVDGSRILIRGAQPRSEMFSFNGSAFISDWESNDFWADITPFVFLKGYIYGFQQAASLKSLGLVCADASNGREIWREDMPYGGVTFVDDIGFVLMKDGMLIAAEMTATGYNELSKGSLPGEEFEYWSPAVVSGGRLYAKNMAGKIYCVDVGAE